LKIPLNCAPCAVVFDLDGTLADTAEDICQALNAALSTVNLPSLDTSTARLMIGRGPAVLVDRALIHLGVGPEEGLPELLTDAFGRCYEEHGNKFSKLYDGAKHCLEALAAMSISTAVCSNKPHEFCLSLIDDLQISGLVDVINGSVTGEPKKPHPGLLLKTLESLNVTANQALYVGDSETDVQTARAAGMPIALVDYGYSDTSVEQLGADFILSSLQDLPAIWREIRPSVQPVKQPLPRSVSS